MARFEGALAAARCPQRGLPRAACQGNRQGLRRRFLRCAGACEGARIAGALAIPFVKALTEKVAAVSSEAARYVRFGATSQDVLDTAAVLCMREACERISALAVALGDASATLAKRHRATPMVARTLLQPAAPVPFGWKAAMWLAPLARSYPHFRGAAREACVLQFGGAAGTLAAFRDKASEVARRLAEELGLETAVTWHSARDGFARLGAETAILTGLAAKIARDVTLLAQPEVGEAAEPAVEGGGRLVEHAAQAQSGRMPARARGGACPRPRCDAARRARTRARTRPRTVAVAVVHPARARSRRRKRARGDVGGAERSRGQSEGDGREPGAHERTRVLRSSGVARVAPGRGPTLRTGAARRTPPARGRARRRRCEETARNPVRAAK